MAITSGVYPVYMNEFKIGTEGRTSAAAGMVPIKEMETFSITIDGNVEEWNPLDNEGWVNRMVTGKALSLSMSGKRCVGDKGNDYVASCAWKSGVDCDSKFEWELPDGSKLAFDCIISVTNVGGGDSKNVAALEFEVQSHGKPQYTPAPSAGA